tara:strand:+ start:1174 stop:1371 length:198 start_codon:yes stop_codon:yes gene_type:complete
MNAHYQHAKYCMAKKIRYELGDDTLTPGARIPWKKWFQIKYGESLDEYFKNLAVEVEKTARLSAG